MGEHGPHGSGHPLVPAIKNLLPDLYLDIGNRKSANGALGQGFLRDVIRKEGHAHAFFLVNEAATDYVGTITLLDEYGRSVSYPPTCKTGLTGTVRFYRKN